jgi:hypothetical protein
MNPVEKLLAFIGEQVKIVAEAAKKGQESHSSGSPLGLGPWFAGPKKPAAPPPIQGTDAARNLSQNVSLSTPQGPEARGKDVFGATQGLLGAAGGFIPGLGKIAQMMGQVRHFANAFKNFQEVISKATAPEPMTALPATPQGPKVPLLGHKPVIYAKGPVQGPKIVDAEYEAKPKQAPLLLEYKPKKPIPFAEPVPIPNAPVPMAGVGGRRSAKFDPRSATGDVPEKAQPARRDTPKRMEAGPVARAGPEPEVALAGPRPAQYNPRRRAPYVPGESKPVLPRKSLLERRLGGAQPPEPTPLLSGPSGGGGGFGEIGDKIEGVMKAITGLMEGGLVKALSGVVQAVGGGGSGSGPIPHGTVHPLASPVATMIGNGGGGVDSLMAFPRVLRKWGTIAESLGTVAAVA